MIKWEDPLQTTKDATSVARLDLPEITRPLAPYGGAATNETTEATPDDARRLSVDSNGIINSPSSHRPGTPLTYGWALKKYLDGCASHWMPHDIGMYADLRLWRDPKGLTADERSIIKRNLGFFSATDAQATNNLVLAIYRQITNPECRQYLLRQAFEVTLHSRACRYVVDSLGLDGEELYHLYQDVPAVTHKSMWTRSATRHLSDPSFQTGNRANDQALLRELIAFYLIFGGIFSQVGFTQILSMGRRNKMVGTAEQFLRILRDASRHTDFGVDVINQIKVENPHLWTNHFRREIARMLWDAVALETQYAYDTMPRGILGLNAPMFEEYLHYVANGRCAQIGLPELFPGATNPFPWMSEALDVDGKPAVFGRPAAASRTSRALNWD